MLIWGQEEQYPLKGALDKNNIATLTFFQKKVKIVITLIVLALVMTAY